MVSIHETAASSTTQVSSSNTPVSNVKKQSSKKQSKDSPVPSDSSVTKKRKKNSNRKSLVVMEELPETQTATELIHKKKQTEMNADDIIANDIQASQSRLPPNNDHIVVSDPVSSNSSSSLSKLSVHRCRFVPYMMSSIVSMAYLHHHCDCTSSTIPPTQKLAVARSNGDIHIYIQDGSSKQWFLFSTLSTPYQIETIVFLHHRLFLGTLGGRVVEYDLDSLTQVRICPVEFGCVWSMAALPSKSLLALGTENGEIRLVRVRDQVIEEEDDDDDDMVTTENSQTSRYIPTLEWVQQKFEKLKNRIMSITWSSSGNFLVAGTAKGTIHVMDVKSGRSIRHMALDKIKGEDTIAWDLKMLSDDQTVVSADSLGYVSFWHIKSGTLWKRVKAHAADVLTLAIEYHPENGPNSEVIYSSGVDRKVSQICNVPVESTVGKESQKGQKNNNTSTTWIVTAQKRYHSHDVRSLIHFNQTLVSGGMDTGLIFSSSTSHFGRMKQERMPLYPHRSPVSLASDVGLLLCNSEKSLQLWSVFGTAESAKDESSKRYLLKMNIKCQSNIIASAISKDGKWITCADSSAVRLFSVEFDPISQTVQVKKCKDVLDNITGAHSVTFSPDGSRLIVGAFDGVIYVVSLSDKSEEIKVIGKLSKHAEVGQNGQVGKTVPAIVSLAVSADGQWLVSADTRNYMHIFQMDSLQYTGTLPRFQSPMTSLTFHPYRPTTLIVTCASNHFYLFDVENNRLTDWSQKNSDLLPTRFTSRREVIMGVAFDERRPNILLFWGPTYLCTVDLEKELVDKDAFLTVAKRQKLSSTTSPEQHDSSSPQIVSEAFRMDHRYQAIMFVQSMQHGQLVLIERPILHALAQLPSAFYKHAYGT